MRTSKEKAEQLLAQIQQIADARIRPMMGEYILYVEDKVVGQINHSQLSIKITPFGEEFAKDLMREAPYNGAKPAFVIPQEKINNLTWMQSFLSGTVKDLK
jgi:TfoX/Sxy family transcriptional regulator of competence genes